MASNNLFKFATKELSQDAFICWCVNWINYPDAQLYQLAVDVLHPFGQENVNGKIVIKQQFKKADVLLVFPEENKVIILEDKTFTSEHDDQIAKYKRDVYAAADELGVSEPEIKTVYFKTGFFYDADKLIKYDRRADIVIDGQTFLKVIEGYKGHSEILDSYALYLSDLIKWYDIYGDFRGKYDNGEWYLTKEYIAQYRLMRTFFPEEMWNKDTDVFYVDSGSSAGRPWTETDIIENQSFSSSKDTYGIFWRIDSDVDGPYISLRFYEDMDKSNAEKVRRHKESYEKMIEAVRSIIGKEEIQLDWDKDRLYDGYRGGYKESSLLRIVLARFLEDWDNRGEQLVKDVNHITDDFRALLPDLNI